MENIDIEILNGENPLIDESTELVSLKFFESINAIPYFIIKINTVKPENFYNLNELTFRIRTEYSNYSYLGCVTKFGFGTGENVIFGYLVSFETLTKRSSSFLGSSIINAIQSLNIRNSITGLKEVTGEFYQIQETKTEAFLRIILTSEPGTVFGINRDSIKCFKLDDKTNPLDMAIGSQIVNLEARRFFSFERDTNVDMVTQTTNNYNWRGANYPILPGRSIVTPEMGFNLIKNRKTSGELNIQITKSFNYYVDFQVGDTIKVTDLPLPTQYFKVIQREVELQDYDLLINLRLAAEGVW